MVEMGVGDTRRYPAGEEAAEEADRDAATRESDVEDAPLAAVLEPVGQDTDSQSSSRTGSLLVVLLLCLLTWIFVPGP